MQEITYKQTNFGIQVDGLTHFSPMKIAESGQCFRMDKYIVPDFLKSDLVYLYRAASKDQTVFVGKRKELDSFLFLTSEEDFKNYWFDYFDLGSDYDRIFEIINNGDDGFLKAAAAYGDGIRILRQDLWETLVSFIISQRRSIPSIKTSVDRLCSLYGGEGHYSGITLPHAAFIARSFPTAFPDDPEKLSFLGVGYRSRYLAALMNQPDLDKILTDPAYASEHLLDIHGVGDKVANCVKLFALHQMDSYPIDVWVQRIIDNVYNGKFDHTKYGQWAGFVQQLQFYYYRNSDSSRRFDINTLTGGSKNGHL